MGKIYLAKEETARDISTKMGNTHGTLTNPNWCNEETLQAIETLLGTHDDTGGSATSGTIFAKINKIIEAANIGQDKKFRSPISVRSIKSGTTVTGKGVAFFGGAVINTLKVDGTTVPIENGGRYTSSSGYKYTLTSINFSKSLYITASNVDYDNAAMVVLY